MSKPRVVPTAKSIIENKLLIALEDPGKVGCIFDEEDLTTLIGALDYVCASSAAANLEKEETLLSDLICLKESAFRGQD